MKIRILHIIETIASGGVEQTLLTLVNGLDKNRFEHKIICTWFGGPIADQFLDLQIEIIAIGSSNHPFHFSKHKIVYQTIKKFNPHIVHGAVFEGMTLASISGWLTAVPVIILEETSDPQNRSKKANWLLKRFVSLSDKIMAISPPVENYLQNVTKIDSSKIAMIPNGVIIPKFPESKLIELERQRLNISNDCIIIGFVGRLFNDHKRVTDLIKALSLLANYKWVLLIIGEGPDSSLIEEKVQEFGLTESVKFLGFQSNTSLYYSLMDIFCISSSREGFGLVAAEAMLHSLPVIATKVGGLQDVVIDQETGFLVPPYNPTAIAEKLQILINNPQLRKEMGKAGHNRATQHYTSDRYCQQVENLYLTLLKQKGILPN